MSKCIMLPPSSYIKLFVNLNYLTVSSEDTYESIRDKKDGLPLVESDARMKMKNFKCLLAVFMCYFDLNENVYFM